MLLAIMLGAAVELVVETLFGDASYYQQHRWCPFVACMLGGTIAFAARRVRYCEAGLWMGPLIVVLGIYILVG